MCIDLSLCYHSEGSLPVCHFDRTLLHSFIADSFSLRDLLASHCWSHIWHLPKLTHTHTHCLYVWTVCVLTKKVGNSEFTVYNSPLSIYGANQRAGCYNLYPHLLMSCQWDSLVNLRQQTVITLCKVWPCAVQVIFVWTGRGNGVMLLTSSNLLCEFYDWVVFTWPLHVFCNILESQHL